MDWQHVFLKTIEFTKNVASSDRASNRGFSYVVNERWKVQYVC